MSDRKSIANKISSLCVDRGLRYYSKSKLLTDPLYGGVYEELDGNGLPLLDIGCGIGILAMYLRERGWQPLVMGIDYDSDKIERGKAMLEKGGYPLVEIAQGDARDGLPINAGNVTILDILQFFSPEEQEKLIHIAGGRVCHGGKLIIRSALKQKSLRFSITWLGDMMAKMTSWMKAAPTHYPTEEMFRKVLERDGFTVEIKPFWGKTPFNNYLIVAERSMVQPGM
ncbi:methyltransferase domain-containing protein [Verrucomicrobiaceae bacterium 5K15]|uniref:Methyltransferase domain-containing protein n=1 Tax=Oceaniferula flava TaxID=2800421 RepID=A0AAE2SE90_9BACT|nr:methyltransferase domain-containing protein [Oceaniferula flavus]MBK1854920.1 methyltransferase domain-containing protein [Oceaniferula flavus]MBM1136226.1 methyltransferase domain-containing protein [Oceaniferula flavus]